MLAAAAISLVVALACAGLGSVVLRFAQSGAPAAVERLSLGLGLGFGCLTLLLFFAGIVGVLTKGTIAILVLPFSVLGVLWIRRLGADPNSTQKSLARGRDSYLASRLAIGLFLVCALANFVGALTPPNFIDALIYHLYVPKQFLRAHAIVELRGIWQHYQPMASELLYMVPLAFGSPKGASLLCAAMGLLAALGTFLLGVRLAGPFVGVLAAVIFYNNPMVAWESTSCFVDLAVAALGTMGLLALLNWEHNRQRGWLIMSALLMGFAASCKLNAASFAVVGAGVVGVVSIRPEGARVALSRFLVFGLVAVVPVVPWLIRSWILTGNPLYPFATFLFGGNSDRAAIDWVFAHYGVGYSFLDRVLAPWHLFTQGAAFENGNYLSPLPMLMAPVMVFRAWKERGPRSLLLVVALALLAIWSAGGHVARYVLPVEPLLCALAADALFWLASFVGRRRVMAIACGSVFLLFGTFSTLLYDKQFIPVALGRESESRYLQRTTWYFDTFQEVCTGVGSGGRILTNSQKPTFYLDCAQGRANDHDFDDPVRLKRIIADGNFTDVLILGNEGLEAKVASLGSMVQLVWHRDVDLLVSRTFGRIAKASVAWYRVKTN